MMNKRLSRPFRTLTITLFAAVAGMFLTPEVNAQNNTNSPYTRFGYGRLTDPGFSKSQAMGGVAYGLRTKTNINPANPAAYSSIDSTSFLFEFGVSGLASNFNSDGASRNTFNANLEYLALQFPVTRWLGMSAGILPYSFVGYKYSFNDSIAMPGNPSDEEYYKYTQTFSGSGGISQVFLGLSVNLFKHLSLGVNAYYKFGGIDHFRSLTVNSPNSEPTNSALHTSNLFVSSFNFRYGLQYSETIGKKHAFTVGLIYENKMKLNGELTQTTLGTDTVTYNSKEQFELPTTYGGGFTYTYNNKLTVGADFTLQEYAKAKYYGKTDSLNNRMKISVGAEYIHNPTGNRYVDRMPWRAGFNYSNSYIKVGGQNTQDFGITFGVGFPLRTIKSVLNVNFEYGNVGTSKFSTLNENYFKFGLNMTINELWFFKSKIQ